VYLPRKFGYDKRRSHLSSRVCSGEISREQALAEIQRAPYDAVLQEEDCHYVAKKLGIGRPELDALIAAPPRRFEDFDSYQKRASSAWFSLLRRGYTAARRVMRPPQPAPVTG
jgi:hypothetical protein